MTERFDVDIEECLNGHCARHTLIGKGQFLLDTKKLIEETAQQTVAAMQTAYREDVTALQAKLEARLTEMDKQFEALTNKIEDNHHQVWQHITELKDEMNVLRRRTVCNTRRSVKRARI